MKSTVMAMHRMARQKSRLSERPPSVKSLGPVTPKVVVQHRSDMLMDEQIHNVENVQRSLGRALSNLESARASQELIQHRTHVLELQQRLESMMLVLKIVHKVNIELVYARADLHKALKESGNISQARKRIGWLEDRIDNLLGKRRQRVTKDEAEPDRGEYNAAGQMDSISNLSSFDAAEPSVMSSAMESPMTRQQGQNRDLVHGMDTGDVNHLEGSLRKLDEAVREGSVFITDPMDRISDQSVTPDLSTSRIEENDIQQVEDKVPGRLPTHAGHQHPHSRSVFITKPPVNINGNLDTPASVGRSVVTSPLSSGLSSPTTDDKITGLQITSQLLPESPPKVKSVERRSQRSKGSHVTIQSPTEMDFFGSEREEEAAEVESDAGKAYWKSEHHRFKFSDHAPLLLELDPLSYHQMGLAVPGTFVEPVVRSTELPWRAERRGSNVTDIHERALEGLSVQMNKLYHRVREASLMSVHPADPKDIKRATTFMQDYDKSSRATSSRIGSEPTLAKHGLNRPDSKEPIAFPALDKERLGSSLSNRLVYYPNPLPYPEKLAITTTNHGKELPRTSGVFSKSVPGKDPPAERIVDQHNLYEETKFTSSLFRSKATNKKPLTNSEKKFRKMLKAGKGDTGGPPERQQSLRSAAQLVSAMVKFQDTGAKWNDMKPLSGVLEHSGLKWERVKSIVHNNLISTNEDERIDAAHHLGLLKSGDSMVLYALRERLRHDENKRVVYEATKSLISLGCWDEEVMTQIVNYLLDGNRNMKYNILQTMINAKNIHYVDKKTSVFSDLTHVCSLLCMNMDANDDISFYAAVTLGQLCVVDKHAKAKLHSMFEKSENTHNKAQALEILVKQLNLHDGDIVNGVLNQLQRSPVWKYRKEAAHQLVHLGSRHVLVNGQSETVFEILERRLWDDPKKEVRMEVAKVLAAFNLFARACEKVEKKLEDASEDVRAQAVISVGTLGMKNERIIRALLEMTDLDASEYVRLMVIRTFGVLNCQDKRVMRVLRTKEGGDGAMAREAKRTLELFTKTVPSAPSTSGTSTRPTDASTV